MTAVIEGQQIRPARQPADRDYISFSSLSTFRQCSLRWYFKYVAGLPELATSASLVLGGAIHASAEHHFREILAGNAPPSLEALLDAYQQAWAERTTAEVHFGKDEDRASCDQLAQRMLAAFHVSPFAQPRGAIIGVEEELRGELIPGVPDLLARIDLLVDEGDRVVVTDLKTARSRWSQDQAEDAGEQLVLYGQLVQELAPEKEVALQFVVISKAKEPAIDRHPITFDERRVRRTKQIVERTWAAIEGGHFYPSPSAMSCPSCPFRDACRAWPSR